MPAPRYRGAEALAHPEKHLDPDEKGENPGKVGRRRYTVSKLCNVVYAYELDRHLRREGPNKTETPITVNAFDPGAVPGTGLARDHAPLARFAWGRGLASLVPALRRLGAPFGTAETSGRALAGMVTDPALEGVSGGYFEIGKKARSSEESYDREKAGDLFDANARLVSLLPGGTLPGLLGALPTERP